MIGVSDELDDVHEKSVAALSNEVCVRNGGRFCSGSRLVSSKSCDSTTGGSTIISLFFCETTVLLWELPSEERALLRLKIRIDIWNTGEREGTIGE